MPPSFHRFDMAQASTATLATIATLVLLALVAAYWSWQWLAPRPEPRAGTVLLVDGNPASARALFGSLEEGQNNGSATGLAIRLLGLVTASEGRRGYAVLRLEPREIRTVREGDEIAPGIRLAEVATDHLILERAGTRETLAWPDKKPFTEAAAAQIGK